MKRTLLAWALLEVLLVAAFFPVSATGQTWSAEQQEVLNHLRSCWDAWRTKNFEKWVASCRPVDDFAHWQAGQGAPDRLDTWRKSADNDWNIRGVKYGWYDLRPLTVQVSGDVAIVYFYAYSTSTVDGDQTLREEKRTEVFRRIDGRWVLLGGMRVRVTP